MKLKDIPNMVTASSVIGGLACGVLLLMAPNQLLRIPAMVLFFFLPGHVLLWILWSKGQEPDWEWRIAMTLPTSMALVGMVLLLLHYCGRYSYSTVVILMAGLNLGLIGLALRRRNIHFLAKDLNDLGLPLDKFNAGLRLDRWHGVLLCSCLAVPISVVYAFSIHRPPHHFTEFYLFADDSSVTFPIRVLDDAPPALGFGIANHEGRAIDYAVLAVGNTGDITAELWSDSVTVVSGSVVERALDLRTLPDQTQELWLYLYLGGNPSPYRSLHLILNTGTWPTVRYTEGANREAKPADETH